MRLTEKTNDLCSYNIDQDFSPQYSNGYDINFGVCTLEDIVKKLGQIEDIEEELDIDLKLLPKLFKLKEKDIVFVKENTGIKEAIVTGNVLQNGKLIVFAYYVFDGIYITPVLPYSTYGKKWALTRKELE